MDATVKCRIAQEAAQTILEEAHEPAEEDMHLEDLQLSHMPAAFAATTRRSELPSTTSLNTIHPVQDSLEEVEVAMESNALHAFLLLVDGKEQVEAILNPGCQVVAMSEEVCNMLTLLYDLDVCLNMVSANGGVDQSLGVVWNVGFLVGDITVYLQVHILWSPAYDILLGRPFDILTQSIVWNFWNENQTITIKDPNTGRSVTVPTVERGSHRFTEKCSIPCQQRSGF